MGERRLFTVALCALALVVSSNGSRLFVWPTYNTLEYQRAQQMAGHGDPEAQRFVSGKTDVNPFGAW